FKRSDLPGARAPQAPSAEGAASRLEAFEVALRRTQRTRDSGLAAAAREGESRVKRVAPPLWLIGATELSKIKRSAHPRGVRPSRCSRKLDRGALKRIHPDSTFLIARLKVKGGPGGFARRALIIPGDDLLSRVKHYHRPRMLNGRVRNGNGCGHPGKLTGKSPGRGPA